MANFLPTRVALSVGFFVLAQCHQGFHRISAVLSSGSVRPVTSEGETARGLSNATSPPSRIGGCRGFECVQRYVALPDNVFSWTDTKRRLNGTVELRSGQVCWTGYVLNMTSQSWLTSADHNRPVWFHPVVVVVPSNLVPGSAAATWATMVVGGAALYNDDLHDPQAVVADLGDVQAAVHFAVRTGAIAAAVMQVPNQPIIFTDDPKQKSRYEDGLKAYTWEKFVENPDRTDWPIELPNAKAVVRGMDVVSQFTSRNLKLAAPERFGVTGCSKRGMASWMTAAVDPRVQAVLPCVISINHHHLIHDVIRSLGNPAYALADYQETEVIAHVDAHPQSDLLFSIIDPYSYRERLTMPKFVLNTGADEFFPPEVSRAYWNGLEGPKQHMIIGNLPHQGWMTTENFIPAASAFLNSIILEKPEPRIDWSVDPSTGAIRVWQISHHTPQKVSLWSSRTCDSTRRDFRWGFLGKGDQCLKCGMQHPLEEKCINLMVHWSEYPLGETAPGSRTWLASLAPPPDGRWAAFFVAFEYEPPVPGGDPYQMTTTVSVVPDRYPFPDCSGFGCMGTELVLASADGHVSRHQPPQAD